VDPAIGAEPDATARIARLLTRADEVRKAAPVRTDAEVVRGQLAELLAEARSLLDEVADEHLRLELAGGIARRVADLDQDEIAAMLVGSPDVAPAPTTTDDPARVPAGQHLTPGWPVLHVGRAPAWTRDEVRLVVTGLVERRTVLSFDDLRALPVREVVRDFHCVTTWSRLDNTWTGVRLREVLEQAGVRAGATHAVVSGAPAYSTNLSIDDLLADDVLLAWAHDGAPLDTQHGGPLRLVVPHLYGWKSVKWVTEVRLLDREVRGYWEERGYHDRGDPWREERFRGD
jgi:DMSO/TMAO reductase YedYZ molybdopterin-dependent catalytic subunit